MQGVTHQAIEPPCVRAALRLAAIPVMWISSRTMASHFIGCLLLIVAALQLLGAGDDRRATVHVVEDLEATRSFEPVEPVVRAMVDRGLQSLARTNDTRAAWRRFIKPTDVVGFRVCSAPGPVTGKIGRAHV